MLRTILGGLAAATALLATSTASAGTIDLNRTGSLGGLVQSGSFGFDTDGNGTADLSGNGGLFDWTTEDDDGSGLGNGRKFWTFCIELTSTVGNVLDNATVLEGTTNIAGVAPDDGPQLTPAKVNAIGYLLRLIDQDGNANGVLDAGENGSAAAGQLAIWEIVYETGTSGFSLTGAGDFTTTAAATNAAVLGANSYLSQVNAVFNGLSDSWGDGVIAFSKDGSQDQITLIPLPAPVLMGLAGLGLAGVARRRMRNA